MGKKDILIDWLPRWDWKTPAFATGISNLCDIGKKRYPIQFYDFDSHDLTEEILNIIRRLFKFDCLMFKTQNGIHFVSFGILYYRKPKEIRKKATKISKKLNQDYTFRKRNYLVLRISPKIENSLIISGKPKFMVALKLPSHNVHISLAHLLLYHRVIGLPKAIFEYYLQCNLIDTKIKLHFYKTKGSGGD